MWTWLQKFNFLLNPQWVYKTMSAVLPWAGFLTLGLFGYGLWGALWQSPPDYQQSDAVRIIYIHVPCAMLSMMCYFFLAMVSAGILIWKIKIFEIFAKAIVPIGALFTFLALLTGSLWGKPMWGTWWVWDARLTSELILLFLFLGVMLLESSLPEQSKKSKACALLAVVGFIDLPIIHYSVQWWHTLHQGSTLTVFSKPSIDSEMLVPLLVMMLGFLMLTITLWMIKVRTLLLNTYPDKTWVKERLEGVCSNF